MISSMLGSNSGSQQPFMRAKHLKLSSQQLHHNFITVGFIIFHHRFHHNYLVRWLNFFVVVVNWDSGCNEKLTIHPSSFMKIPVMLAT
jgi:hypothetical protein